MKRMSTSSLLPLLSICAAALLAGLPGAATAQEASTPFSTMTLRAGPTANVSRGQLHDLWQPGHGALLEAEMPFYAGRVEAGGALNRYATRGEHHADPPRFDALFVFAGWRGQWQPASWLRLSAGPRLGNYLMLFEGGELADPKQEAEMMVALNARVDVRLVSSWHVFAGGSYQKLFTAQRIRLAHLAAGVSHDLTTPRWLRAFLE